MKDSSDSKQWAPTIAKIAFLTLTAALVITVVYMVRMVLHAIILGTLFAIILMPLHRRLTGKVKQYLIYRRKSKSDENADEKAILSRSRLLSSFLMVFLVFFVIVIPVSAFAASVARQGVDAIPKAIRWIKNDMSSTAENFYEKNKKRLHLESIIKFTDDIIDNYFSEETYKPQEANGSVESELPPAERAYEGLEDSADGIDQSPAAAEATSDAPAIAGRSTANLSRFIGKIAVSCLNWLRKMIVAMLAETGIIIFNFFIMLFVMFHIFLDGENIWKFLLSISPFSDEDQKHIVERIKNVSKAIFFSIFGTAIIQGTLSAIAFKIVGIPALFWGVLLGLCSIIPFVGTGLVWVPVTIYLFLTEQFWQGTFILVFCGGIVANIDSIVRPFLMKHGGKTGMSYMVLFFSIMGGLQTFGLVGIIYGPIIMGMCGICVLIFSTHFKNVTQSQENSLEE